jgi:hypothetical protein
MKTLRSSMRRAGPSASVLLLGALLLLPAAGAEAQRLDRQGSQSNTSSSSSSRGQSSARATHPSSGSTRSTTPPATRSQRGGRTSTRVATPPRTHERPAQSAGPKESRRDTGSAPVRSLGGDPGRRPHGTDDHRHYYPRSGHRYYPYYPHSYPYYPYGYGYGYGYYYGPYGYLYFPHIYVGGSYDRYDTNSMGALDLDVSPEKAEIWINGSPVGVADQYDGFPTYLWLEKGTYDVVIFKEGFQTISRQYTVYPGVVIDVNDSMVRGESVRPEDLASPSTAIRDERLRRDRERAERAEAEETWRRDSGSAVTGRDPEGVGRLLLTVDPGDSAVYLDGQFLGTGAEISQLSAGLVVEPGQHVVELVRPGYQTEKIPVTVPPGERVTLDLEMQQR